MEHTIEPWSFELSDDNEGGIYVVAQSHGNKRTIATCHEMEFQEIGSAIANSRRIVACANACAGIPTAELETAGRLSNAEESTLRRLKKQRDELLAAAQKALDECCDLASTPAGNALEAAISSVKGQ